MRKPPFLSERAVRGRGGAVLPRDLGMIPTVQTSLALGASCSSGRWGLGRVRVRGGSRHQRQR
jgi:hypothetical protein